MKWSNRVAVMLVMCFASTAWAEPNSAPDIQIETVSGVPYELAREALEEAIAAEGLAAPVVSHFADMLARTATDLGHPAELYRQAHIYTFCTVSAAAQLATENPAFIALCPLSIAIYQLPDEDAVQLAFRPTGLDSTGGKMASATQARIVSNTLSVLGLR